LDDGAECDLDLGHFDLPRQSLTRLSNVTTGQILRHRIDKEPARRFLGGLCRLSLTSPTRSNDRLSTCSAAESGAGCQLLRNRRHRGRHREPDPFWSDPAVKEATWGRHESFIFTLPWYPTSKAAGRAQDQTYPAQCQRSSGASVFSRTLSSAAPERPLFRQCSVKNSSVLAIPKARRHSNTDVALPVRGTTGHWAAVRAGRYDCGGAGCSFSAMDGNCSPGRITSGLTIRFGGVRGLWWGKYVALHDALSVGGEALNHASISQQRRRGHPLAQCRGFGDRRAGQAG